MIDRSHHAAGHHVDRGGLVDHVYVAVDEPGREESAIHVDHHGVRRGFRLGGQHIGNYAVGEGQRHAGPAGQQTAHHKGAGLRGIRRRVRALRHVGKKGVLAIDPTLGQASACTRERACVRLQIGAIAAGGVGSRSRRGAARTSNGQRQKHHTKKA